MERDQEDNRLRDLIASGTEIVGATVGVAAGYVVGGPLGTVGGAATGLITGKVFRRVGLEMYSRVLGPRERMRIGAAYASAAARVKINLDAGETPRSDEFFEEVDGRSKADQLLEGVLLKARDAYEEDKVWYIGNLLGNIMFSPVRLEEGVLLLEYAQDMTYRELLCLACIQRKEDFNLTRWPAHMWGPIGWPVHGVINELYSLYQRALVTQEVGNVWSPSYIQPDNLSLMPLGVLMYELMCLNEVPRQAIEDAVAQHLRSEPVFAAPDSASS